MSKKATRKDVLYALEYGHERLIKTIVIGNTGSKNPDHYTLSVSGWEVPPGIAREILSDPHVFEADRGLFPGMGQSFEWRAFAA